MAEPWSARRLPVSSVARHGLTLLDLLIDAGPLSRAAACEKLGWTESRFGSALAYAREILCPQLGVVIPHPTPEDGWRYQVTEEWEPVEAGASYSLGQVETRLTSLYRDVQILKPKLDPRSRAGRRANFLEKHLGHILGTLKEIG